MEEEMSTQIGATTTDGNTTNINNNNDINDKTHMSGNEEVNSNTYPSNTVTANTITTSGVVVDMNYNKNFAPQDDYLPYIPTTSAATRPLILDVLVSHFEALDEEYYQKDFEQQMTKYKREREYSEMDRSTNNRKADTTTNIGKRLRETHGTTDNNKDNNKSSDHKDQKDTSEEEQRQKMLSEQQREDDLIGISGTVYTKDPPTDRRGLLKELHQYNLFLERDSDVSSCEGEIEAIAANINVINQKIRRKEEVLAMTEEKETVDVRIYERGWGRSGRKIGYTSSRGGMRGGRQQGRGGGGGWRGNNNADNQQHYRQHYGHNTMGYNNTSRSVVNTTDGPIIGNCPSHENDDSHYTQEHPTDQHVADVGNDKWQDDLNMALLPEGDHHGEMSVTGDMLAKADVDLIGEADGEEDFSSLMLKDEIIENDINNNDDSNTNNHDNNNNNDDNNNNNEGNIPVSEEVTQSTQTLPIPKPEESSKGLLPLPTTTTTISQQHINYNTTHRPYTNNNNNYNNNNNNNRKQQTYNRRTQSGYHTNTHTSSDIYHHNGSSTSTNIVAAVGHVARHRQVFLTNTDLTKAYLARATFTERIRDELERHHATRARRQHDLDELRQRSKAKREEERLCYYTLHQPPCRQVKARLLSNQTQRGRVSVKGNNGSNTTRYHTATTGTQSVFLLQHNKVLMDADEKSRHGVGHGEVVIDGQRGQRAIVSSSASSLFSSLTSISSSNNKGIIRAAASATVGTLKGGDDNINSNEHGCTDEALVAMRRFRNRAEELRRLRKRDGFMYSSNNNSSDHVFLINVSDMHVGRVGSVLTPAQRVLEEYSVHEAKRRKF